MISYVLPARPDPRTLIPEHFTLTGMVSGKAASISDVLYYPQDNRIEFVLDGTEGSHSENYRIEGRGVLDSTGQEFEIQAENCGIALERKAEYGEVLPVRVSYQKDGIPLYSIKGQSDITVIIKIVNGTGHSLYGLTAAAVCGTGAGARTFRSEAFDLEAENCKTVSVDITGYVIPNDGDIRILLE